MRSVLTIKNKDLKTFTLYFSTLDCNKYYQYISITIYSKFLLIEFYLKLLPCDIILA